MMVLTVEDIYAQVAVGLNGECVFMSIDDSSQRLKSDSRFRAANSILSSVEIPQKPGIYQFRGYVVANATAGNNYYGTLSELL